MNAANSEPLARRRRFPRRQPEPEVPALEPIAEELADMDLDEREQIRAVLDRWRFD